MTTDGAPGALRAARMRQGWSQSDAAREIVALARRRGEPVAAAASLKTLLSRWENGHVVPEPQYRALLAELLGCTPAELGIDPDARDVAAVTGTARLRAALAEAGAVDGTGLDLWLEQLATASRLDDELGAAGAGGLVRAQVEQLDRTLVHTLAAERRAAVAAVLAGATALAGAQFLDTGELDRAWEAYQRSRAAAREAHRPVAAAAALAGLASVLVEAGEPAAALTLLGGEPPHGPSAAVVRWQIARGLANAAAGHPEAAHEAFGRAERSLPHGASSQGGPASGVDRAWPGPLVIELADIELADLHRQRGEALVALHDPSAVTPLREALAAAPRSARHRGALHADLAVALAGNDPDDAAEHAREARAIAVRIGSTRIPARLGPP
ncbi:MAG: hypothetical protein QOF00_4740 [Pseudonocardiales bacterium]|jgi:transcriptional regulator with XRE-family HTH domain|nr:hypothetical protein [Pseudonocardiales bacterium]